MKKAKLFLPLLSLATVGSVALPLVSCGCNGNKQEDEVVVVELQPYLDDTLSLLMSDPIDVRKDETYEVSIKCGDFPHFLESDEKTRGIITILDNSSGQYYNLSKSNASLKLNNKNYELEHYTNNLKYSHFMGTDNGPYCEEKTIFFGVKTPFDEDQGEEPDIFLETDTIVIKFQSEENIENASIALQIM